MEKKADLKKNKQTDELPLYYQDYLTAIQTKLSYNAKHLKRENKIADTWVMNSWSSHG